MVNKEQKKEEGELCIKGGSFGCTCKNCQKEFMGILDKNFPPEESKALREEELWEELQVEVMEDYLSDARFGEKLITEEDRKKHLEIMRNHYDKLISFINKLLKQDRERIKEKVGGLKKTQWDKSPRFVGTKDMWGERYAEIDSDKTNGYNQAINDFLQILDEEQL